MTIPPMRKKPSKSSPSLLLGLAGGVVVASLHITSTRAISFVATLPVALIAVGLFILKSEIAMNAVVSNGIIAGALAAIVAITYFLGIKSFNRETLMTKI